MAEFRSNHVWGEKNIQLSKTYEQPRLGGPPPDAGRPHEVVASVAPGAVNEITPIAPERRDFGGPQSVCEFRVIIGGIE